MHKNIAWDLFLKFVNHQILQKEDRERKWDSDELEIETIYLRRALFNANLFIKLLASILYSYLRLFHFLKSKDVSRIYQHLVYFFDEIKWTNICCRHVRWKIANEMIQCRTNIVDIATLLKCVHNMWLISIYKYIISFHLFNRKYYLMFE